MAERTRFPDAFGSRRLLDAATTSSYRFGALAARRLPAVLAHGMVTPAGFGANLASPERRAMIERHLRRADPTLRGLRLRRAIQEAFDSYARYWLESFRLPKSHEDFLLSLRLSHVEGDYLFVHAGISQSQLRSGDLAFALRKSRPEDLLWNRTSGDLPHDLGITMVYGHTPNEDFGVRWNTPFSIGVDTGAVYGGPLTAIRLPDEKVFQA